MRKNFKIFFTLLLAFLVAVPSAWATESASDNQDGESNVDIKEIIFHHLGDGYGWEVPFSHVYRIPLPVIVKAEDGKWFCFSSANLTEVEVIKDEKTGKEKKELIPVIYKTRRDGKEYMFALGPHSSNYKGKVVELFPLQAGEVAKVADIEKQYKTEHPDAHEATLDGFVNFGGNYYREYRTFDISITKNVLALLLASLLVTLMVFSVVRYYNKKGLKAPRKGMGFMEMLIDFVYTGVIKASLGAKKAKKFGPYLLTCFFFILTMNLLGLIVIFPGGANLTGNIAVTLVLALLTFIVTNIRASKHYWKEILWPDVPMFLKFPLPIMQFIEVFGIFTKPAALCVRLFANMMGGHMIVITLVCLIFIFAPIGYAALGGSVVISILFTIFMLLLDVLVSFIQAYVFTMLSTMFIAMSHESGHDHVEDESAEQMAEIVDI
jgi:F-type H+-transporting ATPase subunit a